MNIITRKDTMLVSLNPVELADIGARNAMLYKIYSKIESDERDAERKGKVTFLSRRAPVSYYSHRSGQVHVLRVILSFWRYFRDVEATSPWEQHIREEIVAFGLSGKADELTARYCG